MKTVFTSRASAQRYADAEGLIPGEYEICERDPRRWRHSKYKWGLWQSYYIEHIWEYRLHQYHLHNATQGSNIS